MNKQIFVTLFLMGMMAACSSPIQTTQPTPSITSLADATQTQFPLTTKPEQSQPLEPCLLADFPAAQTFADYLTPQNLSAWSPDSRTLAYVSTTEHRAEIPVDLHFTPANPINTLEILASGEVKSLAWSPDGSRLALSVFRSEDQLFTILVAGADGADIQDLMPGEAARTGTGVGTKFIHSWWDENRLLVLAHCGTGCSRPFLLNLHDGKQTSFFEPEREGEYLGVDYTWSPDKKWVVVLSGASPQLGIAPGEGGKITWLSPNLKDFFTFSPSWAPDSSRFAFLRQPVDASQLPELWVWEVQSGEAIHLLNGVVSDVWSPSSEDGIAVLTLGQPDLAPDGSWRGVHASPDGPNTLGMGVYRMNSTKMIIFEELGEIALGYSQLGSEFSSRLLPPVWSPESWRIAFRDTDNNPWVFSVGYGRANLGTGTDSVTGFEWSPDGARLVVKTENRLWVYSVPCSEAASPLPNLTAISGTNLSTTPAYSGPLTPEQANNLPQIEAIDAIRTLFSLPGLPLEFIGVGTMINSPNGDLAVALYQDTEGRKYSVESESNQVVEIDARPALSTISPDALPLSQNELSEKAMGYIRGAIPEYDSLQAGLSYEEGVKENYFFFTWRTTDFSGTMNRPFVQIGLHKSGELFAYYNTLTYRGLP